MNPIPENNPKALPTVGHYQLIECIGRGGMGLVYSARDPRLGRDVAIKCLRTELFEPHYRERFRREALLLAKLNHPHIVHIYDYIETDDQLALVMELIDGQNLQIHLREQIVPIHQRMQWLIQIAQGLAVAHDAGIIHRDLKAENILITKHKQAKISDLGIAKSQDFNATLTDHVAGSYCSMSPEQAMGEKLDFKSDLFSFGLLAYQLLCGAHPFGETENKLQIMQRIISHPPIPPTKNNPSLPPEVCDLLGQLLSKNPEKRPDNTHWVAAQLERLSPLVAEAAFEADDTQLLANNSEKKPSGRTTKVKYTSHPTFETRYVASENRGQAFSEFFEEYKVTIAFVFVAIIALAGIGAWVMQPVPPKYVAVIPPTLTAEGMQESQQELVKGAVYNALLQGMLHIDDHYLIPREEINSQDSVEAIRRATGTNEIITSSIQCKIDICSISLSRLTSKKSTQADRLSIYDTKTIEVLTDNYLSISQIIQSNLGRMYQIDLIDSWKNFSEQEYKEFLTTNQVYLTEGADYSLLETLQNLTEKSKGIAPVQTLYRNISLDLFYENFNQKYINDLDEFLSLVPKDEQKSIPHLLNMFYLSIAINNFGKAEEIIASIKKENQNDAFQLDMMAYLLLSKNDYQAAINIYKKIIKLKPSTTNHYNIALAHWYAGDYNSAKLHVNDAFHLSPMDYKSNQLRGLIALSEGDIENAISFFSKTLAKKEDAANLNNIGLAYLLRNDYIRARENLARAVNQAPSIIPFQLNLADAEALLGNTDTALKLYESVISSTENSKTREALIMQAQAFAHTHEYSKAVKAVQELQRIDPQGVETKYTSSLVYALAGDIVSATTSIEDALKENMPLAWFDLPWFDRLCSHERFLTILEDHGAIDRCN